jgi:hypothetical protein
MHNMNLKGASNLNSMAIDTGADATGLGSAGAAPAAAIEASPGTIKKDVNFFVNIQVGTSECKNA